MGAVVLGMRQLRAKVRGLHSVALKASNAALKRVAVHAYRGLIKDTPKGYTGQTRRSWRYYSHAESGMTHGWMITNTSKVMSFLEHGTKAHGPVKAKKLFIPLRKGVALGGYKKGMKFGKDFVLTDRVRGIKPIKIVEKRKKIVRRQGSVVIKSILKTIKQSWK